MTSHRVPTHLDHPDGIGKFSMRQVFVGGAALLYVAPNVWSMTPAWGPPIGNLIREHYAGLSFIVPSGALPLLPLAATLVALAPMAALALPLNPPAEHGAISLLQWARRRGMIQPKQTRKDLGRLKVNGNRVLSDFGIHAVWELPSVNLRLAESAEVENKQDLWGEFLNGLTTPIQAATTSARIDAETIVGQIERYDALKVARGPRENARRVGAWLRQDVTSRHLIERRHFLSIMAEDETTFIDSEQEVVDGIGSLGLRPDLIQRLEGDELKVIVNRTWSPYPAPVGKKLLGPQKPQFPAANAVWSDDEWHIVLAWSRWPRKLRDNALAPLIDGHYEVDVIQHITPLEADDILDALERRLEIMEATENVSSRFRKRTIAIEDLSEYIHALEGGEESPFDVAVLLHVHGPNKPETGTTAKNVASRSRRSGARAKYLRWEHREALTSVAPLGMLDLDKRTKRVDTSSVKRLYPWSASSMWMEDAVPIGETLDSKRPVGWNPWRRPMIANPHFASYMMSGGGKGFFWKVFSSRALFGGVTQEFFGFDQAEEDLELGEYGRWAEYCGVEYRHVHGVTDFAAAFADLDNYRWLGPGICWNIAQLPRADRPRFLAETKARLWKRATEHPARRQWFVDELWSFVKITADMGIEPFWIAQCLAAIEDLVRTGRHAQVGGAFFTQRAKDSLDVPVMQIIQGQAATQMYGPQLPGDITDIKDRLHWTESVVTAIRHFIPGQSLFNAGPWSVAMRVTASPEEYNMANTDGLPSREATLPSDAADADDDTEDVA